MSAFRPLGLTAARPGIESSLVRSRALPDQPVLNAELTAKLGRDVYKIDALPTTNGDAFSLTFDHVASPWRQGVFVGTDGSLEVSGFRKPAFVIWSDTAPPATTIRILESLSRVLTLYNVWDSGRGRSMESQSATSGMLVERSTDGRTTYRCQDIGRAASFDRLVFSIRRQVTVANTD